jgi:hypothetical protein
MPKACALVLSRFFGIDDGLNTCGRNRFIVALYPLKFKKGDLYYS